MYQFKNRIDIGLGSILYRKNADKTYVQPCRSSSAFNYYISGGHIFDFYTYKMEAKQGEIVYIPQGGCYTNHLTSDDTEFYQLNFNIYDNNKPVALFNELKILDSNQSQKYISLFSDVFTQYTKHNFTCTPLCISNILTLIGVFSTDKLGTNSQNGGINRIADVLTYIEEFYYLDTPITELAKISSTSVSNLEKLFKQCFGVSPTTYRNKTRIEFAKQFLAGGYTIEATANLTGFSDRYYFSKTFKKMTGMSPSAFLHSHEI